MIPEFIPPEIAEKLPGKSFSVKMPATIRAALTTPKKIGVTEHAEKYRVITEGPHLGPWRREYAPHSVQIMDTFGQPYVQEIWFCGPEQAGKTSTMLNCMHWGAHVAPGDIFYLMPDEKAAKKTIGRKIKPLILQSKCLSEVLTGKQDDLSLNQLILGNGVSIFPAWANSPSSMAAFPAKYCFNDESDKGTLLSGRETDRIRLVKKRLRLYGKRGKAFHSSTPAQLFIWKGVQSCPQVFEYRLRCPICDQLERMDIANIIGIDLLTVDQIEAGKEVVYICSNCMEKWTTIDRETAILNGIWVAIKGASLARPPRVGFHLRAFECLDVSLEEIAIAYIKSENGNVVDKIAYANGYECMDYEYEQGDKKEDFILRLVDEDLPPLTCPGDPAYLMVIADTQQNGFFYKVVAFGWGSDLPVAMIDYGFVKDFADLIEVQKRQYSTPSGKKYSPHSGWIDSGGGNDPDRKKHTRTVQVYQFCRKNPFWRPVKGQQQLEQSWNQTVQDYWPSSVGNKVPIPGGLRLYKINVTLWKDEVDRKLRIEPGEPGCIRLHSGTDKEYAGQLCVEYRNERGIWKCPKGKDNHQWDNWVYGMAAADVLGIKDFIKPEPNIKKSNGVKVFSRGVQA